MTLLLPLIAFLIGYFAVQYLSPFRPFLALILAKILIPVIIIYHMVFYQQGSIWLMLFSFFSSLLMYLFFYSRDQDRLKALCLSYLNMAWLGFPFALAVFGTEATSPMVALYIGGSVFGNICAVMALGDGTQSKQSIFRKVILSPPIIALSIAALLLPWDFSDDQNHVVIQSVYLTSKWLMTFTGMCILGMWLSQVRIQFQDLLESTRFAIQKLILGLLFCAFAYYCLPIPQDFITFSVMLMFFCLPPAANIVALETHYQGTGRSARYIASDTVVSCILIGCLWLLVHILT
ncbi:AEC family transporter [Acinetobacter sp. KS-LM10]|uniref:AEC family transporter n=1 Tax=Acinetobacter sp. KS-LM10 TaxID=3120518 RepID=UPI0030D51239